MKRLLLILILTFSFQSWTKADDIRDFEIEGISIGDSLLDFYKIDEIKSAPKKYYPNSKKYYHLSFVDKKVVYDGLKFHIFNMDNKYIIQSFQGRLTIDNIEDCLIKKKLVKDQISSSLSVINTDDYEFDYPQYANSKAIVSALYINGGKIKIWCDDLSEALNDEGYLSGLAVDISPQKFDKWLNNEAYK